MTSVLICRFSKNGYLLVISLQQSVRGVLYMKPCVLHLSVCVDVGRAVLSKQLDPRKVCSIGMSDN